MAKQHAGAQQALAQAHRRERAPLVMCGVPMCVPNKVSGVLLSLLKHIFTNLQLYISVTHLLFSHTPGCCRSLTLWSRCTISNRNFPALFSLSLGLSGSLLLSRRVRSERIL